MLVNKYSLMGCLVYVEIGVSKGCLTTLEIPMDKQRISPMFNDDSPLKVLATLMSITAGYSFLSSWAIQYLHLNIPSLAALVNAYIIGSFVTFTFYYLYILPRWQKISSDQSFMKQQLTGLNEIAMSM